TFWFCMVCFFFFSSRRRHTRFSRDWSSDVCSSDLSKASVVEACSSYLTGDGTPKSVLFHTKRSARLSPLAAFRGYVSKKVFSKRSEERRVGKECRSWWSA